MNPIIVWLRQDLRLEDNPALFYAAQESVVIPVYILDTSPPKQWQLGGAQRWWLHYSLINLQKQFAKHHLQLILRRGDPKKILLDLVEKTQAKAVYWNRCYEPHAIARDAKIKTFLKQYKIDNEIYNASLLFDPWEIKNQQGEYFKVFTAFWKNCLKQAKPKSLLKIPKLNPYSHHLTSDKLNSWDLLPQQPNWAKAFNSIWQPGSNGAQKRLISFLKNGLRGYANNRDVPAIDGTSRLSPHLHFGEIGPRQIWHAVQQELTHRNNISADSERFLAELGWREFPYYLLYHFPNLPDKPFQTKFANFTWHNNKKLLRAWQRGETGYPLIDAGMRQLWRIGWMHNRVRMIVASFLTKDLLIPWQQGEVWFWDTLVDADLANNSAGWQWVAGSGADAAPYFRIFNPILQSKKFDPEGNYIRQWIPEFKNLPNKYIHEPWTAPKEILKQAKVKLGGNYPYTIINHEFARDRALTEFKKLKK